MGKQLGALTALPWTSPVKVRRSMEWSHQMLKLSRNSEGCCMVADNLERAWCYVLGYLFHFFTKSSLTF